MTLREQQRALAVATTAARAAGGLMRRNLTRAKNVNEATQHDIKLELDVRCQKLIERTLRRAFPTVAILGEEGILGDPSAPARWVVDPIDGTVNFTYGIPHACVSIALQVRDANSKFPGDPLRGYTTLVGVVYDPFLDELWTAVRGQRAKLNGKPISVSGRARLDGMDGMDAATVRAAVRRVLDVRAADDAELIANAVNSNVTAAWRARKRGAYFANPCFTQIHPTCIPQSGDHQSKLTLMSESLRNDGRVWVPKDKADCAKPAAEIPEEARDYFLERKYPSYGNLAPRDIASRAAKEVCDEGRGVGQLVDGKRLGVYLDFSAAIKRLGEAEVRAQGQPRSPGHGQSRLR